MLVVAEPRHFPQESFALLDRVAGTVRPDEPALASWSTGYFEQHRTRLAGDLALVIASDAEDDLLAEFVPSVGRLA